MTQDEKAEIDVQLDRLEEIVEEIEGESVSLERSIELFEEGVQLADDIRERLDEAESDLKQVVEDSKGTFSWEDLEI